MIRRVEGRGAAQARQWPCPWLPVAVLVVLVGGSMNAEAWTAPSGAGVSTGGGLRLHAAVGRPTPSPVGHRLGWTVAEPEGGATKKEQGIASENDEWNDARLVGIQPNPFNPAAIIRYAARSGTHVTLAIFTASGVRVRTLVDGWVRARGTQAAVWDGKADNGASMGSGVYLCRLIANGRASTAKLVLLK